MLGEYSLSDSQNRVQYLRAGEPKGGRKQAVPTGRRAVTAETVSGATVSDWTLQCNIQGLQSTQVTKSSSQEELGPWLDLTGPDLPAAFVLHRLFPFLVRNVSWTAGC